VAGEKPPGAEQLDERYWANFRARARERVGAQMGLPICAVMIFVAILKIVEPMDYPAGDLRNSIEFRVVLYGALIILGSAFAIRGLRALIGDSWNRR
jgi:hypothetical protein